MTYSAIGIVHNRQSIDFLRRSRGIWVLGGRPMMSSRDLDGLMTPGGVPVHRSIQPFLFICAVLVVSIAQSALGQVRIEITNANTNRSAERTPSHQDKSNQHVTYDASVSTIRKRLGKSFRDHRTNHFVIVSDADSKSIRRLASTLEQTHHQFVRSCRRIGLETTPLPRTFPCILFSKRQEFLNYGQQYDNLQVEWVGGYYASAGNYMVFYLPEDDASIVNANEQLAQLDTRVESSKIQLKAARQQRNTERARLLQEHIRKLTMHIKSQQQRISDVASDHADARTIHETTHLLAFNMGIQSRYRVPPFWMSEGLATNFESLDPGHAFGPGFEDARRRSDFSTCLQEDRLMPLAEFLSFSDVGPSQTEDEAEVMYPQAYAFFSWAYRFRKEALAQCFRDFGADHNEKGALPPGVLDRAKNLEVIVSAFGPIDKLERDWLRWERGQLKK